MTRLTDPVTIGGLELPNRLYRAPLLECAGNGPEAVETLIRELEPAAASGAGLIFQGASIVTADGGCAAPNMTRVHDPKFVARLSRLTDTIHDHGSRIFIQLGHGGLRSLSLWHAGHRKRHGTTPQTAVSRPPWHLRVADRLGLLSVEPDVLSTAEVYDLAEAFGRAAGHAVDAGYDGIHLSGANMSIVQQFLSPYYNRRDDEFADGVRFLEVVADEIRAHAGDVPLVTKVPAETAAPPFVRRRLTRGDAIDAAQRLAAGEYDAVVPVAVSVYWDASIVRGAYPDRAWAASELQADYDAAFGGRARAQAVRALTWLDTQLHPREPCWNDSLCRAVRAAVDVPVLCEGGIRERTHCERLLGEAENRPAADLVGMGRPFYAEPKLPARLLAGGDALCASCNNCTVPQAAGEPGRCRTPSVVRQRGRLEADDAYERNKE